MSIYSITAIWTNSGRAKNFKLNAHSKEEAKERAKAYMRTEFGADPDEGWVFEINKQ